MSLCPFMCLSLAKSSTHLPAPDLHHPLELRGEIDMPQSSQCISPLRPHTIVRSSSLKTERPGKQRPRNCSFTVPITSKDRNTYPCSCPQALSLIQMIGSKEGTAWGGWTSVFLDPLLPIASHPAAPHLRSSSPQLFVFLKPSLLQPTISRLSSRNQSIDSRKFISNRQNDHPRDSRSSD